MFWIAVLAQGPTIDVIPWAVGATGLGTAAITAWYLYHRTKVTDPQDRQEQRAHVEALVDTLTEKFDKALERQEEKFQQTLERQEKKFDDALARRETALESLRDRFLNRLDQIEQNRISFHEEMHKDRLAWVNAVNNFTDQLSQVLAILADTNGRIKG